MISAKYKDYGLLDKEELLSRLMDDEDLAKQVLEACLPELQQKLEIFQGQLDDQSSMEAVKTIHSIKGTALNSGLTALSHVSRDIESALKEERRELVDSLRDDFVAVGQATVQELQAYLAA